MSCVSVRSLFRHSVVLGLLTSTLLMGCGPEGPPGTGGAGGDGGAGGSGGVGGGAPGSSPCDWTRWIGIKPAEDIPCENYAPPGPGNWAAEGLFDKVSPSPLPSALARYCLFTWNGQAPQGPSSVDVQALLTHANTVAIEALAQDCEVVWPLTNLPQVALEHRRWIHEAAGGLASLPLTTLADAPVRPVRLAIIDNAPDRPWGELPFISSSTESPRPGEHGAVLAYLGRDLGCPEDPGSGVGACAVHPETVLGMSGGSANTGSNGGLYGTKGEVATAIARALVDWKEDLSPDSEVRLVLNLSLGWEDHSTDPGSEDPNNCHVEKPEALSAPARAVYDAIRLARCHGAAVLAAAGNHTGGNRPHEALMCPAHFTMWDAPSDLECGDGEEPLLEAGFTEQYENITELTLRPATKPNDPLVTAVGAVDYGDQVLVPHRPNSLPPLVGPGAFAAAYEGYFTPVDLDSTLPASPPATLSGTSVGTLVASAVTAAAWAYEPEVGAAEVTGHVYTHGAVVRQPESTTSMIAEQHRSESPPPVMRASLCRTLKGIGLLSSGTKCSDLDKGLQEVEVSPQNPACSESTWAAWNDHFPLPFEIEPAGEEWTSTPLYTFYTAAAGLDVIPQPVYPTCTVCGISQGPQPESPSILYLHMNQAHDGTLHLVKVSGGEAVSYPVSSEYGAIAHTLGGVAIAPGDRFFLQWKEPDPQNQGDPPSSAFTQLAILP